MREILLDATPDQLPINTFLTYGDTRTGKTIFGSTFPRPLVIADITEGGYQSILTMDRSSWFEPDVKPIVKGVESMNDIAMLSPWIDEQIKSGRIKSIIFDAFSFYCDFYLASIIKVQTKVDNRQAYGSLGTHLRELRSVLHSKRVNVMWSCLAKHPDTDDPKGRPMIPGQQSDKFSAGVDFLFHSRLEQIKTGGKIVEERYELRTRQFGSYIVGNRLGIKADQLPDPFSGTYADLITCLGYDVDALRKSLPKLVEPSTVKPPMTTRPPIINVKPAPKVTIPVSLANQPK